MWLLVSEYSCSKFKELLVLREQTKQNVQNLLQGITMEFSLNTSSKEAIDTLPSILRFALTVALRVVNSSTIRNK